MQGVSKAGQIYFMSQTGVVKSATYTCIALIFIFLLSFIALECIGSKWETVCSESKECVRFLQWM